jgi:group I intron endonuclease
MNYENGQIYSIRNKIDTLIYIGSTCQPLYKRFHQHKISSKTQSFKLYKHFKDIGIDNFYIELIENFPCKDKNELRAKEQYYCRLYDTFNNGLNKISAIVDDIRKKEVKERDKKKMKEYNNNNRKIIKEYKKEYQQTHKIDIKEKKKNIISPIKQN